MSNVNKILHSWRRPCDTWSWMTTAYTPWGTHKTWKLYDCQLKGTALPLPWKRPGKLIQKIIDFAHIHGKKPIIYDCSTACQLQRAFQSALGILSASTLWHTACPAHPFKVGASSQTAPCCPILMSPTKHSVQLLQHHIICLHII